MRPSLSPAFLQSSDTGHIADGSSMPGRMQYNRRGTPRIGGNNMAATPQPDDNISRIGHEIYETKLRPKVETTENIGKLISIDIHTGDYEIGDKPLSTIQRLQARRPEAEIWTERIGYDAVYAVGGSLRRVDQ
jgi:hypothetical protein